MPLPILTRLGSSTFSLAAIPQTSTGLGLSTHTLQVATWLSAESNKVCLSLRRTQQQGQPATMTDSVTQARIALTVQTIVAAGLEETRTDDTAATDISLPTAAMPNVAAMEAALHRQIPPLPNRHKHRPQHQHLLQHQAVAATMTHAVLDRIAAVVCARATVSAADHDVAFDRQLWTTLKMS